MPVELEGPIEEKLGLDIPSGLLTIDEKVLEFAHSTLSYKPVRYLNGKTNRTTQTIYHLHELHIRNIIQELLPLVAKEGRDYIRFLDLGCGERLFSPNKCVFFETGEEKEPYSDDHSIYCTVRPDVRVFSLRYLRVLEFGFDNGDFWNPIADERGLFRLDYMNKKHRSLFEDAVPEGYFDFILSTAFFGHVEKEWLLASYIPPTRKNLGWIEKFLNPSYGVLSIVTSSIKPDYYPDVTPEYAPPEKSLSDKVYRTTLSKTIYLKDFFWDKTKALMELYGKLSTQKCTAIRDPKYQVLMYE